MHDYVVLLNWNGWRDTCECLASLMRLNGPAPRVIVCDNASSDGSLDMYEIVKALYESGFDGYIRPDHGRMLWGEKARPGYGLYDRALGAAYINGLWEAVSKSEREGR